MPRIARIVVPKYPHHITQRGTNKSEIFIDTGDRFYFLKLLNEWLVKTQSELWAYCLMNNHFHLLITPDSPDGLGKCLHGVTFRYAQYFNNKYRRRGRFWENRYFSCPVDKDEYLWAVVKYIEMNPVRAKIVQHPEEWRWSSSQKHIKGRDNGDAKLYTWLGGQERKEYAKMMVEEAMQEKIRKATSTGRALFKGNLMDKLEKMLKRTLRPKKGGRPLKKVVKQ